MSQGEIVRLPALGLSARDAARFRTEAVDALIADGNTAQNRVRLVTLIRDAKGSATLGDAGLDETLEAIRSEMRRFGEAEVAPHAHRWHLSNAYIPVEVVAKMAELGVFGLTVPEEYGGLGLSKISMCVVSEELSRAYIGVGSLGTGSDLASLKTRAVRDRDVWRVFGNKTWITHPVRADLMTMLVRTNPDEPGHRGLSILLAEKPRGTDAEPFPVEGLTGGEIEVLGYRGMKEYELSFDGFSVSAENLLGGVEGF